MNNISPLWMILAVFLGGMSNSLAGFLASQEPFNIRKSISTIIITVISTAGIVATYSYATFISIPDVVLAFLAGAGMDKLTKNVVRVIGDKTGGKTDGQS